jgi:Zn-dependent protease with chaperone function
VNLAVCLLAYSIAVTVLGPQLLTSLTRSGAAPRLGVTGWVAAMASVLAAWVGAAAMFVTQLTDSWDHLGEALNGCVSGLRLIALGGYGRALQVGLLAVAALSVAALAVAGTRTALALRRSRHRTHAHAQAARIAAVDTLTGPQGALVLDSTAPAVYCLAGRPRTIVITQAALDSLDDAQLAAVMAHEQAHLRGRHHALLAVTDSLGKVFAHVRLFTEGATDIARLLEMCADDAAARRHSRDTLVDALVALTLPRSGRSPVAATPVTALAATGTGVVQRVQRLLFPPNPTRDRIRLTLVLGVVLLGPVLAVGLAAVAPMLCAG